jgi:hypothetical protein
LLNDLTGRGIDAGAAAATLPGMTWDELKPEQVQALLAIVERHGAYYYRLTKRLEELHLPPADRLYRAVWSVANHIEDVRLILAGHGKVQAGPPKHAVTAREAPPGAGGS